MRMWESWLRKWKRRPLRQRRAGRAQALSILTISDSLITGESTTAEERQNSFMDMVQVALEIL